MRISLEIRRYVLVEAFEKQLDNYEQRKSVAHTSIQECVLRGQCLRETVCFTWSVVKKVCVLHGQWLRKTFPGIEKKKANQKKDTKMPQ